MPANRKVIDYRWVFKLKQTPVEEDRFKARLVAQKFTQHKGIDYEEVYAPVARAENCRDSIKKNLEMMQFDIKTTFLYGELQENIWVELPDGPWPKKHCVKLQKSLYGLKQSSNCWNRKFDKVLPHGVSPRRDQAQMTVFTTDAEVSTSFIWRYM